MDVIPIYKRVDIAGALPFRSQQDIAIGWKYDIDDISDWGG